MTVRYLLACLPGLLAPSAATAQQPLYSPGSVRAEEGLRSPLEPPEQSEDEPRWLVEPDILIHHEHLGEGPRILFIHGGPGFHYPEPSTGLERLAADYEVILYDQRGSGRSSKPFDRFDSATYFANVRELEPTLGLGAQIADIERIRRLLGEDELILLGHSFGGFIATMYAAEFPEHVAALVLAAPADMLVMPQPNGGPFPLIRSRLPAIVQPEFDLFLGSYFNFGALFEQTEETLARLNREFARFYMLAGGATDEEIVEIMRAYVEGPANGGWVVNAIYFSLGMRHDYRSFVARVTAPTLVMHGADDLQQQSVAEAYVEALPNAELAVIEDAAHLMDLEQPDEFARLVRAFLEQGASREGERRPQGRTER